MDEWMSAELEPYEMSAEEEARAVAAIAQAERDIEEMEAMGHGIFQRAPFRPTSRQPRPVKIPSQQGSSMTQGFSRESYT